MLGGKVSFRPSEVVHKVCHAESLSDASSSPKKADKRSPRNQGVGSPRGFALPRRYSRSSVYLGLSQETPTSRASGEFVEEDEWESVRAQWKKKWQGFLAAFDLTPKTDAVFDFLLKLYAHRPVYEELQLLHERHPRELAFYLPQLCQFLLCCQGDSNEAVYLEGLLLDKCRHSLWFAQRVLWFLNAFAAKHPKTAKLVEATQERGEKAADDEKKSFEPPQATKCPSPCAFNFKKLDRCGRGPPYIIGTSRVDWAISFVDELTFYATKLKDVPLRKRNNMLRNTLQALEKEFFPSECFPLPLGTESNVQVVGIIAEESFCFCTNERVPYMICLEVIASTPDEEGIAPETAKSSWKELSDLTGKLQHSLNKGIKDLEGWGQRLASGTKERRSESFDGHAKTSPSNRSDIRKAVELTTVAQGAYSTLASDPEETTESKPDGDEETALGQWLTQSNRARGSGYSHFEFHKDVTPEMRQLVLRESASQGTEEEQVNERIDIDPPAQRLHFDEPEQGSNLEEETKGAADDENPPDKVVAFKERWAMKEKRVRVSRPYGTSPGWKLVPIIVKSDDDLRQEQFALQLIRQFQRIFRDRGLSLFLRPYEVLATNATGGLIQAVSDTISLDALKKNDKSFLSLKEFFQRFYDTEEKRNRARQRFCESLAAYCVVSYLLQIKDRHNGNLLLHAQGYIIHIDFGFILSNSPGNANFESAPFKLTNEFVQVLGGPDAPLFRRFRKLCAQGFLAARRRSEEVVLLVEMMHVGNESMPCFKAGADATVKALRERFQPHMSKAGVVDFVNDLIDVSINHWRTNMYDRYQRCCVGIAY